MGKKIVLNRCYGGFSLSKDVKSMYKNATRDVIRPTGWFSDQDIPRDDPTLIDIIEKIGLEKAGGGFAKLQIIEIPEDVAEDGWIIQDYDGVEWVAEKHRTWP